MTVVLNSSQGLYILLYSVLANSGVRAQVRENITGVVSSVTTSITDRIARSEAESGQQSPLSLKQEKIKDGWIIAAKETSETEDK